MGLIKGLVKTAFYGGIVIGSFFVGKDFSNVDVNRVYRFIDKHPNYEKNIFIYTRDKLEDLDPSFLESLNVKSLTKEQRKEIAKNYLENQIKKSYNQGKKSLENLSKNISNLLSQ